MAHVNGAGGGRRWSALLLAAAAIAAAVVGAKASLVSSRASGAWQIAVRRQLGQADAIRAGLEEVYLREAPQALDVAGARLRAEQLAAAAERLSEPDRSAVLAEASLESGLADHLAVGAAGGLDPGRRLAELRGPAAAGAPIPPRWQAKGDRAARQAVGLVAGTIPVGVAFLVGALAGVFPPLHRRLLLAGAACLAVALAWVVGVQLIL